MCFKLKSCCGLSLKTGAIITIILTVVWCIFCLGGSILFFTRSASKLSSLADGVHQRQRTTWSERSTRDPFEDLNNQWNKNTNHKWDFGGNYQRSSVDHFEDYQKNEKKALGVLSYSLFGFLYIGCLIPGIIALTSILIGVCAQKSIGMLFWIIFMTIALVSSVCLSIIHLTTDDELEGYIKLAGIVLAVIFIFPWIISYSYYCELSDTVRRYGQGGVVLSPATRPIY